MPQLISVLTFALCSGLGVLFASGGIWESALVVAIVNGLFALLVEWFKARLARNRQDEEGRI